MDKDAKDTLISETSGDEKNGRFIKLKEFYGFSRRVMLQRNESVLKFVYFTVPKECNLEFRIIFPGGE